MIAIETDVRSSSHAAPYAHVGPTRVLGVKQHFAGAIGNVVA